MPAITLPTTGQTNWGPVLSAAINLINAQVDTNMTAITARALDSAVVKLTGAQTVDGVKTFSSAPAVPDGSFATAKIVGLVTALGATVNTAGAQTIAGVKTFSSAPVVPDGSFPIAKTTGLQTALNSKTVTLVLGPTDPVPGGTAAGTVILRTA